MKKQVSLTSDEAYALRDRSREKTQYYLKNAAANFKSQEVREWLGKALIELDSWEKWQNLYEDLATDK